MSNKNAEQAAPVDSVEQTTLFKIQGEEQFPSNAAQFDNTFITSSTPLYSQDQFFSRPIEIDNFQWLHGTNFAREVSPWVALYQNDSIRNRMKTFAYMRGNIKLKILVNGSPFWYGLLIAGIVPFPLLNETYIQAKGFAANSSVLDVVLSQYSHGFVNANTSNSFELDVPCYLNNNWISLDREAGGDNVPEDLKHRPLLWISSLNPLQNVSPVVPTSGINVTVLAWFSDIELSTPTGITLAPPSIRSRDHSLRSEGSQSMGGELNPEQKEAVAGSSTISTIASNISSGLNVIKDVPVIGPFAMAGQMVADVVGGLAKMFGFSRPLLLAETHRFLAEPIPNLSSTQGSFAGFKMSVDPLQEVSIDPRIMQISGDDELTIASIAKRTALVSLFPVTADMKGVNGIVASVLVTPMISHVVTDFTVASPCAFAALPFNYWKGTMKYRFQLVASSFHRARIAIVYDPYVRSAHIGDPTTVILNNHMNIVMDLQELDGFELDIPWYSAAPYLETSNNIGMPSYTTPILYQTGTTPLVGYQDQHNGVFSILVLNELVSTQEVVNPITINMYASCPDLEVFFPDVINRQGYFDVTGFVEEEENNEVSVRTGNLVSESDIMGSAAMSDYACIGPQVNESQATKVFFGESILSFRSLLKRFTTILRFKSNEFQDVSMRYKLLIPYLHTGELWPEAATALNGSNSIGMLEYLRFAYMGTRGAIRSIVRSTNRDSVIHYRTASTTQEINDVATMFRTGEVFGLPNAVNAGTVVNPVLQNNSLSFETPFYTRNRFNLCCDQYYGTKNTSYKQDPNSVTVDLVHTSNTMVDDTTRVVVDWGAADDFTYVGFLSAPIHRVRYLNPT